MNLLSLGLVIFFGAIGIGFGAILVGIGVAIALGKIDYKED